VSTAAVAPVPLTLLRLGRISNLPTVWTNVLAAVILAGADWRDWRVGIVLAAMSMFYVGGMFLNDFFDRTIDTKERPERPIPSGAIAAGRVAAVGFVLITVGGAAMAAMGSAAAGMAALLAITIVAYNVWHKGNPLAPVMMGACRALVYGATAAALTARIPMLVVVPATAMAAYVAGVTYAARQESLDRVGNLWPLLLLAAPLAVALAMIPVDVGAVAICLVFAAWTGAAVRLLARRLCPGAVPRAVASLIAGISLADAALLASIGAVVPALVAITGAAATLAAQKYVPGT
jgi:4-hydroxybenzoate polyprenyltransferase